MVTHSPRYQLLVCAARDKIGYSRLMTLLLLALWKVCITAETYYGAAQPSVAPPTRLFPPIQSVGLIFLNLFPLIAEFLFKVGTRLC